MTGIPDKAFVAAQDAYIRAHIGGDHFDALRAAITAALPYLNTVVSVDFEKAYPPFENGYRAGIEAAAKVADQIGDGSACCRAIAINIRAMADEKVKER